VFVAHEPGQRRPTIVRDLRAAGIAADTDYAGRSLKGQLGYGQKHANATLIVAGDDWTLRRGGELDVTVRDIDHLKELL
jgi:histidyl-tRNA synthetase